MGELAERIKTAENLPTASPDLIREYNNQCCLKCLHRRGSHGKVICFVISCSCRKFVEHVGKHERTVTGE